MHDARPMMADDDDDDRQIGHLSVSGDLKRSREFRKNIKKY